MTRFLLVGLLALGVTPVFAGESYTEHETYEKRSFKVEPAPPAGTVEETETSRIERPRAPVVEERRTVEPGPVVRERKTETRTETED
jgi:hypothetical protein